MSEPASNTIDCLLDLEGLTIVGAVVDERITPGQYMAARTLFLSDGTGLSFNGHGSFWRVSKKDVGAYLARRRAELERLGRMTVTTTRAKP